MDKEFQQISDDAEIGTRTADKLIQMYTLNGETNWVLMGTFPFSRQYYVTNSTF